MGEPVQYRSKLNERQEREGEFVIASADTAEGLDPAQEVFDVTTATVVTAMESRTVMAVTKRCETHSHPVAAQQGADVIVTESPNDCCASENESFGMYRHFSRLIMMK